MTPASAKSPGTEVHLSTVTKVHAKDPKKIMMEERPDSGEHLAQQLPAGDTWEMYWQKPGQSLRNLGLISNEA